MFEFLGKIFDPKKLGESVLSGLDKTFLTNEERIDYLKELLGLYEPYKLTQRLLTIMFGGVFLFVHFTTAMTHLAFKLKGADTDVLMSLYTENNKSLGTIVLVIVTFYFGGGVMEGVVKRLKNL